MAQSVVGSVADGTVIGMQKVVAWQSGWACGLEQGISSGLHVTGEVADGHEPLG